MRVKSPIYNIVSPIVASITSSLESFEEAKNSRSIITIVGTDTVKDRIEEMKKINEMRANEGVFVEDFTMVANTDLFKD